RRGERPPPRFGWRTTPRCCGASRPRPDPRGFCGAEETPRRGAAYGACLSATAASSSRTAFPLRPATPMPRRLALVLVLLAGCASTDEARLAEPGGYGSGDEVGYALARTDEGIRTVQLYRSGDEGSLPVVGL